MVDDFRLFTERQLNILIMAPIASGILSIIGSLTIVVDILGDRQRKLKQVYHRLVFMMALMDIFCTGGVLALNGWAVPVGSPGNLYAKGNVTTCNAAGFFLMMFQSPALYSAFLSFYYLLLIRYEKSERFIEKRIEPFLHAFAILSPMTLGIVGWRSEYFNATEVVPGWCWLGHGPGGCEVYDEIECTRGMENIETFNMVLLTATSGLVWIFIITDMTLIVMKVWTQERKLRRYGEANQRTIRTRQTALQAVLYILATIITWVGPVVEALKPVFFSNRQDDESYYFPISFTLKFFLPLQGFWNALIYIRPRCKEIIESTMKRFSIIEFVRGSGVLLYKYSSSFKAETSGRSHHSYVDSSNPSSCSNSQRLKMRGELSIYSNESSLERVKTEIDLDVLAEAFSPSNIRNDMLDLEEGDDISSDSRQDGESGGSIVSNKSSSCIQADNLGDALESSSMEGRQSLQEEFRILENKLNDILADSYRSPESPHDPSQNLAQFQKDSWPSQSGLITPPREIATGSRHTSQRKSLTSVSRGLLSESSTRPSQLSLDESESFRNCKDQMHDGEKTREADTIMIEQQEKACQGRQKTPISVLDYDLHVPESDEESMEYNVETNYRKEEKLKIQKLEKNLDDILKGSHFIGPSQMKVAHRNRRHSSKISFRRSSDTHMLNMSTPKSSSCKTFSDQSTKGSYPSVSSRSPKRWSFAISASNSHESAKGSKLCDNSRSPKRWSFAPLTDNVLSTIRNEMRGEDETEQIELDSSVTDVRREQEHGHEDDNQDRILQDDNVALDAEGSTSLYQIEDKAEPANTLAHDTEKPLDNIG